MLQQVLFPLTVPIAKHGYRALPSVPELTAPALFSRIRCAGDPWCLMAVVRRHPRCLSTRDQFHPDFQMKQLCRTDCKATYLKSKTSLWNKEVTLQDALKVELGTRRNDLQEPGTLGYCQGDSKVVQPLWKVWLFLQKLNTEVPYDPAIPLLSTDPTELKSRASDICSVNSGRTHSSQKGETTQVTSNKWMDEQMQSNRRRRCHSALKRKGVLELPGGLSG